jgi:hypothetical protein
MPTTSGRHRARIAKLMSDPRYWNKAHPEHPQVFADSQRAFRDAYPDHPPDGQTAPGTVHVRAYTRTQDGKDIDVSAYDRRQEIAFRPFRSEQPGKSEFLQDIAEGPLHKWLKEEVARRARANGDIVETEVAIVSIDGVPVRLDLLGMKPNGQLYAIEVKTFSYHLFSDNQQKVYPLLDIGGHVFSRSPKIRSFGFEPGQLLPPICLYGLLAAPDGTYATGPLSLSPNCQ